MKFLKDQAFYDAMRLAQQDRDCNAASAKALFQHAVEFVQYKGESG